MTHSTPLIHSISGTRGIVGDNLHPQVALNIGMAFGAFIGKGPVIVGGDTRTSHDMIKSAVISGLLSVGTDVIDIGKVLTPTVQQMITLHSAKGGIVITASHNPVIWNGLKLMNHTGSFLTADEFATFNQILDTPATIQISPWNQVGTLTKITTAIDQHIDLILSKIDVSAIQKANLKVIIDPNNGAGCEANAKLLTKLNVQFTQLNDAPNGHFAHDPEPLKQNLSQIISHMQSQKYDIGFVQDADADRLVILDETGHFIGEDYSLAFCIDYILSTIPDPDKKVVVNLSTSAVIEWIAKKHNATLTQTKIGEANVTEALKSLNAQVGGEGNGGIIYPKIGWGRDSLVGIVIALNHLAHKAKSVSQIVSQYPTYVMLREKQALATKDAVLPFLEKVKTAFPTAPLNSIDGIKATLPDGWVHVRPSNTEPIVRIFIEAPTSEKAGEYLRRLLA
jgi:phosphomannomutase